MQRRAAQRVEGEAILLRRRRCSCFFFSFDLLLLFPLLLLLLLLLHSSSDDRPPRRPRLRRLRVRRLPAPGRQRNEQWRKKEEEGVGRSRSAAAAAEDSPGRARKGAPHRVFRRKEKRTRRRRRSRRRRRRGAGPPPRGPAAPRGRAHRRRGPRARTGHLLRAPQRHHQLFSFCCRRRLWLCRGGGRRERERAALARIARALSQPPAPRRRQAPRPRAVPSRFLGAVLGPREALLLHRAGGGRAGPADEEARAL